MLISQFITEEILLFGGSTAILSGAILTFLLKRSMSLTLSHQTYLCKPIVKAACGYEFGDFRINWKVFCKVIVRESRESLEEIYPPLMHCDPEWMEIREYICPGCGKILSVEAVPPGYPPVFEFLPDIVTFYEKWLGREFLCEKVEFRDLTPEFIRKLQL
jgi:acetone carboxylase gamma subunit